VKDRAEDKVQTAEDRKAAVVGIVGRVGEYRIPLSNSHAIGKMGRSSRQGSTGSTAFGRARRDGWAWRNLLIPGARIIGTGSNRVGREESVQGL